MRKLLWFLPLVLLLAACGEKPVQPEVPEAPPAVTEPIAPPTVEEPEAPPVEEIPVEEPGPMVGLVNLLDPTAETQAKIQQDTEAGTASIDQLDETENVPVVEFIRNGYVLEGENWSLSGTMTVDIAYRAASMTFRCVEDKRNFSEFILLRQQDAASGVRRNITRDGTRLQKTGDEVVLNSLQRSANWPVDFHLMVCDGYLYFFLQEPGETMDLITSYAVEWETSSPRFEVTKNARVTFSQLTMSNDAATVRALYESLAVTGEIKDSANLLFLGNSGLFYYDTPNTFSRLARQAGYLVEVNTVARSSATLTQHVTPTDYLGTLTGAELEKGYDLVFVQELSSCINSDSQMDATRRAVRAIANTARKNGTEPVMYVRAPRNDYGTANDPLNVSRQYDELFGPLGQELGAECCYVNRAFALAYQSGIRNLWHTDNAHQNEKGTYLCACVLFATVFDTSCQVLGDDCLDPALAQSLRDIADKVVFEGVIPW